MEQISMTVMFLCMVISGIVSFVRATDKDTACHPDDVAMAMTMCQGERQMLSYASQTNDTHQLCKSLQHYSDCMKPRVQGCQGTAKMAFDVIVSRFTGEPYNCKTDIQTETTANNDNINYTTMGKDDHEHQGSTDGNNKKWDIDDDQKASTDTIKHTNMSVEISTAVSTNTVNTVSSENMTTVRLHCDTCNSATLIHLHQHSAVFMLCCLIWVWIQTM